MKTSRFYIMGWALLTLLASAAPARASALSLGQTLSVASALFGQANPQQDPRAQVAQLLAAARQAMAEKRLDAAERNIAQAERLNVKFGAFTLKDTPEKARRDLENLKSSDGGGGRGLSKFVPGFLKRDEKPATDPFTAANRGPQNNPPIQPPAGAPPQNPMAGQLAGLPTNVNRAGYVGPVQTAGGPQVRRLPPMGPAQPLPTAPAAGTPQAGANNPQIRQKSDALLLEARKALAVGDVRRARGMVSQAKALGVRYTLHDDEPAKVESAIGKFEQLQARRQSAANDQSYWRQYGRLLLEQGDWMVRWRQFEEAERLANDAQKLPVKYSPFEPNPKALLSRISEARRPAAQFRQQPAPRTTLTATPPGPTEPLPVAPGAPNADAKSQAMMLVRQARTALNSRDINTAQRLAAQAAALNVPDSAYGPQDDRPSFVMLDLQKMMAAGAGQPPIAVIRAGGVGQRPNSANRLAFTPAAQPGTVQPAQAVAAPGDAPTRPTPLPAASELPTPQAPTAKNEAMRLYESAEQALQNSHFDQARQLFQQAAARENELDPETRRASAAGCSIWANLAWTIPTRWRSNSRCCGARCRPRWPTRSVKRVNCKSRDRKKRCSCWKTPALKCSSPGSTTNLASNLYDGSTAT